MRVSDLNKGDRFKLKQEDNIFIFDSLNGRFCNCFYKTEDGSPAKVELLSIELITQEEC